jgi:hypothetical protein
MTAAEIQALLTPYQNGFLPVTNTLTIQCADGTYNATMTSALAVNGIYGGGLIQLLGNAGEVGAGTLHTSQSVAFDFSAGTSHGWQFNFCSVRIVVNNLKITVSDTAHISGIIINTCESRSALTGNYVIGAAKTKSNSGIQSTNSKAVTATNNYVSNLFYGLFANSTGLLYSNNNDDTGTAPNYGLASIRGVLFKGGANQPAGTSAAELNTNGVLV